MGKKYIVEIGRLERLYKAYVNGNGKPDLTWLSPEVDLTPYTEPDLEQVRCQAYEEGRNSLLIEVQKAGKNTIKLEEDEYYQRGLSDAWKAAKKLAQMDTETSENVTGYFGLFRIMENLTPMQAIEKIRQYEQEKEEYHIGDEVIRHYKNEFMEGDDTPSIFLSEEDGYFRCIAFNGRSIIIAEYPKHQYRKTGRHFHEIATILEKMRGEQDG